MNIRPMQLSEIETVLELWNTACIEAVGYPLNERNRAQILKNLEQYTNHDACYCFVAEQNDTLIGFVTGYLQHHPIQLGALGEIEELYVRDNAIEAKKALVHQAVVTLKQGGAGVVTIRVPIDEAQELAFWKNINWEQDTVNFTIYSNVPTDPHTQAIWDSYEV